MSKGKRPPLNDDTLKAIVSAIQNKAEVPPPGFRTRNEWAKVWKLEKTATSKYLTEGVKAGILETKMIRRDLGAYVRHVPHWGLVASKAKKQRS